MPEAAFINQTKENHMDISTATTLASGLVALIVPAFVQTFKKYIAPWTAMIQSAQLFGHYPSV